MQKFQILCLEAFNPRWSSYENLYIHIFVNNPGIREFTRSPEKIRKTMLWCDIAFAFQPK
jgi:hypothetical protein